MFVPLASVVALFATGSWRWAVAVAVLLLVGVVAYEAAAFYRTPMAPTSTEGLVASRHWERVGMAILGAVAVVAMVALWGSRAV
jgi:hypothetical protein